MSTLISEKKPVNPMKLLLTAADHFEKVKKKKNAEKKQNKNYERLPVAEVISGKTSKKL